MSSHTRDRRWNGRPRAYQAEAIRLFCVEREAVVLPWSYVTLSCDVPLCLRVECMTIHAPKHLEYPAGVCIYCGMPGEQRDHLLPRPVTGEALRRYVLVVPSCGECNNFINDFPEAHVGKRRERAQKAIAKRNKNLLDRPHKTAADMRDLGPHLRSVALKNNNRAKAIRLRLSWPTDPYYDLRAFQLAGIEDPAALGLCDEVALALADRPFWKESA